MQLVPTCLQGRMIFIPHYRLKTLATGVADSDLRRDEVTAVGDEAIGQKLPERVAFGRAKDIIAQGAPAAVRSPRWIVEEGGEIGGTALE